MHLKNTTPYFCDLFRNRRCNFPFHKQTMPYSEHLENLLILNKFFSTKLKKKELVKNHLASNLEPLSGS